MGRFSEKAQWIKENKTPVSVATTPNYNSISVGQAAQLGIGKQSWSGNQGRETAQLNSFLRGQASANDAAAFNMAQVAKQRDFIREQRGTSYQAAVGDMKAAGLNPAMLMTNGGSGAGVQSSSVATKQAVSSQAAQYKGIGEMFSNVLGSVAGVVGAANMSKLGTSAILNAATNKGHLRNSIRSEHRAHTDWVRSNKERKYNMFG